MKAVVIDASVIAAAFFPEPHSVAAKALLASGDVLYAPELVYVALAVQIKTTMVSNDRRLVNSLARGPLKDHVVWLGQSQVSGP